MGRELRDNVGEEGGAEGGVPVPNM